MCVGWSQSMESLMTTGDRLLQIQRDAEQKLGLYTLTGAYEIIYCLLDHEYLSAKELQACSRLSATAFYHTLKRLERLGLLESKVNPADRRGLLYRLSDAMTDLVLTQHHGYRDLVINNYRYKESGTYSLDEYRGFIHKTERISHLTGDFQILLYLYLKAGISNFQMSYVVDVSPTKFNQSLKKLQEMGLVKYDKDPRDSRSKRYYVTDQVREALDGLHRQVFRWLDAHPVTRR